MKFVAAVFLAALAALAQQTRLEFDAAALRLNKTAAAASLVRTPAGLRAVNIDFTRLLELAFQTRSFDLSRVPPVLRSERFDIAAKADRPVAGDDFWQMLRSLVEERFRLASHIETKQARVYAMITAGNGPGLVRSADPNCPANPGAADFCGVNARAGLMMGRRVSMADIARELSGYAGRPVQDRTGLVGLFDFHLKWTPESYYTTDGRVKLLNGTPLDTSAPSFFPAVRKQLGLKLEPGSGSIDVVVVDHAEEPSDN